jgi:hypothetical protein
MKRIEITPDLSVEALLLLLDGDDVALTRSRTERIIGKPGKVTLIS